MNKVYVKIYTKNNDNSVSFYKDGYTDLVGRFDYASISTSNLKNVKSIAIFIMSDELGNLFMFYICYNMC